MAAIKSYTDIEQSRKLAEILPLESADMTYRAVVEDARDKTTIKGWEIVTGTKKWEVSVNAIKNNSFSHRNGYIVPCWSLAALLGVLPALGNKHAVFGTSIKESKWHVLYHNIDTLFLEDSGLYDNLIDACYEMILKLHELKIL